MKRLFLLKRVSALHQKITIKYILQASICSQEGLLFIDFDDEVCKKAETVGSLDSGSLDQNDGNLRLIQIFWWPAKHKQLYSSTTLVVSEDSTIKSDDFIVNDDDDDEQEMLNDILTIEKTLHQLEDQFDDIEKTMLTVESEIAKNEEQMLELQREIEEIENNDKGLVGFSVR